MPQPLSMPLFGASGEVRSLLKITVLQTLPPVQNPHFGGGFSCMYGVVDTVGVIFFSFPLLTYSFLLLDLTF
jgi:hypothetical protein